MTGSRPLRLLPFCLASLAAASTAWAFAADPPLAPRIVCKMITKPNTRERMRLCATEAEWERITEQHRRAWQGLPPLVVDPRR